MSVAGPARAELTELLRWRPPAGVLSMYLDIAPGDRGEAWRIELRNGLRSALETVREGTDREVRKRLEATAERIAERVAEGPRPESRARVGFVEVGSENGERWYSLSLPTGPTTVVHASRPMLRPLLAALDQGAPRGVVAVSSEQVRLLAWELGEIRELDSWDLEIFSRDWRERRSRASPDPARAQGVTASGRDQFDQRLEANRERFLRESGRLTAERAAGRDWREIDVFAEDPHFRLFSEGLGKSAMPLQQIDGHNVVSQPAHAIAERLEARLPELGRERERALVAEVLRHAHGGTRGALGLEETLQALQEGRVEHLLLDPDRSHSIPEGSGLDVGADPELPLAERMVEMALATSAAVTLLDGEPAEGLAEQGGIAALLRY